VQQLHDSGLSLRYAMSGIRMSVPLYVLGFTPNPNAVVEKEQWIEPLVMPSPTGDNI